MKLRNKKTGEIKEAKITTASDGTLVIFIPQRWEIAKKYNRFSEVVDDWEDYTPQEPLIKDENIRKAVRLWAYINDIETATYDEIHHDRGLNVFFFEDPEEENVIIQFYGWMPKLEEGKDYSIAELCGEEDNENYNRNCNNNKSGLGRRYS